MLVQPHNFHLIVNQLQNEPELGVDTETTGLRPFHGDRLFSIIIATPTEAYYFDFQNTLTLSLAHIQSLKFLFSKPIDRVFYFQNAKFDLNMLRTEGLEVGGIIHDCKVVARLIRNDHFSYDLESLAAREGLAKSKAVEQYIKEHELWTWHHIPGKKTREKQPHFDKVPLGVIQPYGETDARLPLEIGRRQLAQIKALDETACDSHPKLGPLLENERKLLPVIYRIERAGVQIDRPYSERAIEHYSGRLEQIEHTWREVTGQDFQDSGACFSKTLPPSGRVTRKTGKQSFDAASLEIMAQTVPEAQLVLDWRAAKKSLDFFHGFLYHADSLGVVRSNLDQAGTVTGRFSSSNPNFQQLTKGEDAMELFPVRRAIVPRDGFVFAMLDFEAQEYRIMLDMAGIYTHQRALVEAVLGGLDVHQATANLAKITRTQAKTVNFAILFGSGADLLAARLGITRSAARSLKESVLEAAPEIRVFLRSVESKAKERGYITNWLGRRWHCPNPNFAYRGPNFICQGGGADVLKVAMVTVDARFRQEGLRSRIVLPIHDELVLEVHRSEKDYVIPAVKAIMEKVYPSRFLPLTVGVEWSEKSLADKREWV